MRNKLIKRGKIRALILQRKICLSRFGCDLNSLLTNGGGVFGHQGQNDRENHAEADKNNENESGNIFGKYAFKHTSPIHSERCVL